MLWTKSIGRLLGSIENEYPCRAFKHIGNTHFIPSFGFDQINSTSTNRLEQFRYQKTYSTQISLNSPHFYGYNVYNETKIKTENTKKHEKSTTKTILQRFTLLYNNGLFIYAFRERDLHWIIWDDLTNCIFFEPWSCMRWFSDTN